MEEGILFGSADGSPNLHAPVDTGAPVPAGEAAASHPLLWATLLEERRRFYNSGKLEGLFVTPTGAPLTARLHVSRGTALSSTFVIYPVGCPRGSGDDEVSRLSVRLPCQLACLGDVRLCFLAIYPSRVQLHTLRSLWDTPASAAPPHFPRCGCRHSPATWAISPAVGLYPSGGKPRPCRRWLTMPDAGKFVPEEGHESHGNGAGSPEIVGNDRSWTPKPPRLPVPRSFEGASILTAREGRTLPGPR